MLILSLGKISTEKIETYIFIITRAMFAVSEKIQLEIEAFLALLRRELKGNVNIKHDINFMINFMNLKVNLPFLKHANMKRLN